MAGWEEGSAPKIAFHALVGNVTSNMVNGNTNIGMVTGGLSEALAPEIMKLAEEDPAQAQWISYVLGYATDKILSGNGQQGGTISQYSTKWNLVLNQHAKDVRWKQYVNIFNRFRNEYLKTMADGNPYDGDKIKEAEKNLLYYYNSAKKNHNLPQATELLGLFLEPESYTSIIENTEYITPDFPLYILNSKSKVNQYLSHNRGLNKLLLREAIKETADKGVKQATYVNSRSFYLDGVDEALAYGRASSIVTYEIDGSIVRATITIIDNWDHDKKESKFWFLQDAYILQQSKKRKIYAYKTTYDVIFQYSDLYPPHKRKRKYL